METKFKVLRTAVTKTINEIDQLCHNAPVDLTELTVQLDALEEKRLRLEQLNETYETSSVDTKSPQFEAELHKMEHYRESISRAKSIGNAAKATMSTSTNASHSTGIRLPKLNLPVFDGDVLKWHEFFESFKASVDCKNISDVEKFTYLRQQLRNEALSTVGGLPLTAANDQNALQLLQNRYGNEKRRIRAHVRELLNTESPNFRDVKSLRSFVDRVQLHMRGLAVLQVASDDYEIFLCEILVSKVHFNAKREWAKLDEADMNLTSLLEILEKEAKTLDIVDSTCNRSGPSSRPFEPKRVSVSNSVVKPFGSCSLCGQNDHSAAQCPKLLNTTNATDRKNVVFQAKLCFNCLGKHNSKDCTSTHRCRTCGGRHHTLLHAEGRPPLARGQAAVANSGSHQPNNASNVNTHTATCQNSALLPVVTIPFPSTGGPRYVRALLDSGSERSFILKSELADVDHTVVQRKSLTLHAFGGAQASKRCCIVDIFLESQNMQFIATDTICTFVDSNYYNVEAILQNNGLQGCHLAHSSTIGALIGVDHYYKLVTGNIRRLNDNFVAVESIFGWTLQGVAQNKTDVISNVCSFCDQDLQRYWDSQLSFTVKDDQGTVATNLLQQTWSSLKRVDGRYFAQFPWKEQVTVADTYYCQARFRLFQTVRRLRTTGKLQEYHDVFGQYLKEGIIEPVESTAAITNCRYLPHHPVIREDKTTTKLRIVFDASAKSSDESPSINECMHEGDNLFPSIVGVLLRFRKHPFALAADVEKAFLQVGLLEYDRPFVRFLWFDDISRALTASPSSFQFTRIPFGVKASPFLLSAVIQYQLDRSQTLYPDTVACIRDNIYVDDLLTSAPTPSDLFKVARESKCIFEDMKMNLRKWSSNHAEFLETFDATSEQSMKVLGLGWDRLSDSLGVMFNAPRNVSSKRDLAAVACSLFDPLGFFEPFALQFKFLLRRSWDLKIQWDQSLPNDMLVVISRLMGQFDAINSVKIDRWISFAERATVELHCFGDASYSSYGSVVYLRVNSDGETSSKFLVAKSRLCPSNRQTIPRLELMAAVLTAKLLSSVKKFLHLDTAPTYAYSDSTVCLAWIKSTHKVYKDFV